MDLPRGQKRIEAPLSTPLRLFVGLLGLGVIFAGFTFAAHVGDIMIGAPMFFVGGVLLASAAGGRWIRRTRR
jgi:hypothetical protein